MDANTVCVNEKRIEWVDMLKGIAIICVILGHRDYGGAIAQLFRGEIYSFHIP